MTLYLTFSKEASYEITIPASDTVDKSTGKGTITVNVSNANLENGTYIAVAVSSENYDNAHKTISNDKRSLNAAFYTAIQDDFIRKNPFDFQLNTVIEDGTEPKVPLTAE